MKQRIITSVFLFALLTPSVWGQSSLCPDDQHPHAVDMGLPSGTKWSCMNLGATTPVDWGGYYAWGECETKKIYNSTTNIHRQYGEFLHIGDDISSTEYDAAHVCWGGGWHMPNNQQVEELIQFTTQEVTFVNGITGCEFRSKKNGKAIFLPYSGVIGNKSVQRLQGAGYYWTSVQHPEYKGSACIMLLVGDKVTLDSNGRNWGHTIRPVCSK